MFIQITDAGTALLQAGPFQPTAFTLGSGFSYVPNPTQTGLVGATVYSGTPSAGTVLSANVIRYSALIDRSVGDFEFGEVGLWVGPDLVAIGVSSTLIDKTETTNGRDGNVIRIDVFLSMLGSTYDMWMNIADTDNRLVVANVYSVDQLPPVHDTTTNAYIVDSANTNQLQFFAYSNRRGLWAFDQYKYSTTATTEYTVVGSTSNTLRINGNLEEKLKPVDLGELILQFTTGEFYSICRNIENAVVDLQNDQTVLILHTPLATNPPYGTKFVVYNRDPFNSRFSVVDVATKSSPGIVQIGTGLDVDSSGVIKVNREDVDGGLVFSIVDKDGGQHQGDVALEAQMIAGIVETVNAVGPDPDGNVELDAADVGAIPYAEKGVRGGVPALTGSPDDDPYDLYVLGRLLKEQVPLETLTYRGTWNADTNSASFTDGLGIVHNLTLKDLGLMDEDVMGEDTLELPGTGCVFRVTVPGSTEIDGYSGFRLGDLVVGIPGRWFRISRRSMFQLALSVPDSIPPLSTLFHQVVANRLKSYSNHRAACGLAPAGPVVFDIKVGGMIVGTVGFSSGSTVATVDLTTELEPGAIVSIESPNNTYGMTDLSVALTFTVEE